jgi:hypothetical protein
VRGVRQTGNVVGSLAVLAASSVRRVRWRRHAGARIGMLLGLWVVVHPADRGLVWHPLLAPLMRRWTHLGAAALVAVGLGGHRLLQRGHRSRRCGTLRGGSDVVVPAADRRARDRRRDRAACGSPRAPAAVACGRGGRNPDHRGSRRMACHARTARVTWSTKLHFDLLAGARRRTQSNTFKRRKESCADEFEAEPQTPRRHGYPGGRWTRAPRVEFGYQYPIEYPNQPDRSPHRKSEDPVGIRGCGMARPGLEPGTPRFSVVCSTN